MSQVVNLKDAERRAWTLYFQDGLWDFFFGLLFLAGGLREISDSLWAYLLVLAGILLLILGRKYVTFPRLGEIKFGPKREARRLVLLVLILIAVALTFTVLLLPVLNLASPGPLTGLLFAVIVPVIFVIMAYLMDFRRLYGYAVLVAIFMILTETVGAQAGAVAQIGAGLIALAIGLWHLVRFLRDYPLPVEENMEEGNSNGQS